MSVLEFSRWMDQGTRLLMMDDKIDYLLIILNYLTYFDWAVWPEGCKMMCDTNNDA